MFDHLLIFFLSIVNKSAAYSVVCLCVQQRTHNSKTHYTEHCSVGPTNFIGTTTITTIASMITTARMKISDEDCG